jgi:hypothetical protein
MRVIETSNGRFVVRFNRRGTWAHLTKVDPEGWETTDDGAIWMERDDQTFAGTIQDLMRIPDEEAETVAAESLRQWSERESAEYPRWIRILSRVPPVLMLLGVALVVTLAVVLVLLIVGVF